MRSSTAVKSLLISIPEADDAVTFTFEPTLTHKIACGCIVFIVVPAIEFDDEAFGWAEEIDDVRPDRRLAAEV